MPNPVYKYILRMISKHILSVTYLNEPDLIFFHAVKWFQVFLSNMNNSIYYYHLSVHIYMYIHLICKWIICGEFYF